MNDPHVVALHYRVDVPERVTYDNPPSEHLTTGDFDLVVHEGVAVATLHVHRATAEEARRLVEPVLDAWEIDAALSSGGVPLLRFDFLLADVIDRNPSPPGSPVVVEAVGVACGWSVASATSSVTLRRYPPAPTMRVNADVQTLWFRYSLWRNGRDTLAGMAYFCLTYVRWLESENLEQGRGSFKVSDNFISKLRQLASKGDAKTARKWDIKNRTPHTAVEEQWMDTAIRAIIRRVGEHAAGVTPLKDITMADLPLE